MLNEDKIRLMTKLAIYEQNNGKKSIPVSKYYRSDYMSLKLINSSITVTVAYVIFLSLIVLANVEGFVESVVSPDMDILELGIKIVVGYGVVFLVNFVVSYIIYSKRFKGIREDLKKYNADLKQLYQMYKNEEAYNENNFFSDEFDIRFSRGNELNSDTRELGGIYDDEIIDD